MPDHSALIAHIVSQTRQNVEFLMAQNEIPRDVGQGILAKLPTASDVTLRDLSEQTRRMTIPSPPLSHTSTDYAPPPGPPSGPPVRRAIPPQQPAMQRAKALWTYNEYGSEPNDLSFRAGDIIDIVAETNTDWWTGRLNGKQGLFPSNYVEKIPASASPPSYPPYDDTRALTPASSPAPYLNGPSAQYQPVYNGPPQGGYQSHQPQPYNPYTGPPSQPAPPAQVVVQQAPSGQPPKPSRFGGLGQVLATSAVGGVGFGGAGSAIGGGIVDAIF
ncbi:SH3 domain-containing protein [Multifurca ochricompacta]|uniref:SH3 domain-containing protein n=1 Tax=Multifurca ochricompacta TaxID=376703 RepID=A0AAD4M097_9AGAM|nr:SH3 domain-containing protein [Multifurca ochricompacta]